MRSILIRLLATSGAAWLAMIAIDPGVSAQQPQPRGGTLRIAKLRHAGDWDLTPQAIPNLVNSIREKLKVNLVLKQKDVFPRDPGLVHYPLIYMNGTVVAQFDENDKTALRNHLKQGGGTLFADAVGGSLTFDASFRRFVAELLPDQRLVPIPPGDPLYHQQRGYNLANATRTAAAGGKADFPDLEGVRVDGHWAVIYSRLDIGSALEKEAEIAEQGYTHQSALEISTNIILDVNKP